VVKMLSECFDEGGGAIRHCRPYSAMDYAASMEVNGGEASERTGLIEIQHWWSAGERRKGEPENGAKA